MGWGATAPQLSKFLGNKSIGESLFCYKRLLELKSCQEIVSSQNIEVLKSYFKVLIKMHTRKEPSYLSIYVHTTGLQIFCCFTAKF